MSLDILPERPPGMPPTPKPSSSSAGSTRKLRLFEPALVRMAVGQSFRMLDPRNMARNPVMFLVEVGTVLTAIVTVESIVNHAAIGLIVYQAALTFLLFLTVLFANFASALAEARGKAQADSLRATRADTPAYRLRDLKARHRRGRLLDAAPRGRLRGRRGRSGHPHRRRGRRGRGLGR